MYALGLLCTYVRIYVCIWRSKGSKTGLGKKTKQNKPVSSGILFWQSLFQGASKHPLWPGVSRFEERTLAGSFIRDLAIFIWSSLHLAVSSLFPHWAATPSETIVFSLKKKNHSLLFNLILIRPDHRCHQISLENKSFATLNQTSESNIWSLSVTIFVCACVRASVCMCECVRAVSKSNLSILLSRFDFFLTLLREVL